MKRFTVTMFWGNSQSGTGFCADYSSREEMLKEAKISSEEAASKIGCGARVEQVGQDFLVKLGDTVVVRVEPLEK